MRTSIDDFGTGYSFLSNLYRLPFDELKIDSSFVLGLGLKGESGPVDEVLAGSKIDLCHRLGIYVVAEGVGHQRELEVPARLGCDSVQGYQQSPPAPTERLKAGLLHTRGPPSALRSSQRPHDEVLSPSRRSAMTPRLGSTSQDPAADLGALQVPMPRTVHLDTLLAWAWRAQDQRRSSRCHDVAWFEPYEREVATRWLRIALGSFAAIPLISTPWAHPSLAGLAAPLLVCLLCAAAAAATLRGWHPGSGAWASALLTSIVLIAAIDLITSDATGTGLVVFLAPSVLASALLRRGGAWVVAALISAGMLTVCLDLLPTAQAATTWATVTAVLVLLTALLSHAAHRNHRLTAELRRYAAVDSLTGLVTRRVLDEALAAALRGTAASRGDGLLIVDLDHFKAVNDTHGHLSGDEALRHTGAILTALSGPTAVVSRLGGDELAVLLPGGSRDETAALGHAVVEAVRQSPLHLDRSTDHGPDTGGSVALTVSVGASHSPTHAADSRTLYRAADEALYVAKATGRDRCHISGDPAPDAVAPHMLEGGLMTA